MPECPDPRTDRYREEVARFIFESAKVTIKPHDPHEWALLMTQVDTTVTLATTGTTSAGIADTDQARAHLDWLAGVIAWVCPECVQGKHANCDGTAWDFDADEMTACGCSCRGEAL